MRDLTLAAGLPLPTPTNAAWFTSGAVAVQCCGSCATLQHPPEEVCHSCGATDLGTRALSPRGTVVSFTVVHHATNAALSDVVPYNIVLVSLDDAPHIRIVGNLEGDVRVGMAVEAHWEDFDTEEGATIKLIQWHPAPQGSGPRD